MSVRVRFAPSPTGFLHVGGARTALFNWLFARQTDGTFILRIEDTDEKRSSEEMVDGIMNGMSWLGLDWDEGPFFQSRRLELYQATARRLLADGHAYRDFSAADAQPDGYRAFRDLPMAESDRRADSSEAFAVRFKTPAGKTISFLDLVFGPIEVSSDNLEDFVILRSDGFPTYHLSVVADDSDMKISHVIRGADHLTNTSKHVLLFEALGFSVPTYVHLPLILGPDKKRLSKRHGATSVTEYSQKGMLPEAVRNYLALLGWSPGDDSEILSQDELIHRFDLSRINRANAVFDVSKLEWMNKRYLSAAEPEVLEPYVRRELESHDLWGDRWAGEDRDRFLSILNLLRTRVESLHDFPVYGRAFFTDDFLYEEDAARRYLEFSDTAERDLLLDSIRQLRAEYSELPVFDIGSTEEVLRRIAGERGLKVGQFIGAVRVATTGRGQAPGIFDVLITLGRAETLARLDRLILYLADG